MQFIFLIFVVLLNVFLLFNCILDDWEIAFEAISDLQWLGSGAQGAVFLGRLLQVQLCISMCIYHHSFDIS